MPQPNGSASIRTYASIMVHMDLDADAERRAKLAAGLADHFSSRLIGVAAQEILSPLYFESPVDGVASVIELEERQAASNISEAEAIFRRAVGNLSGVEWRHTLAPPLQYVLEQSRAADLIVAARPGRNRAAPMMIDGGSLAMDAGRPVLFVPPQVDHLSARRVIIGWNDSREARRAIWDSLPLLKAAKEVFVVCIDAKDQDGAKDVSAYLGCHGVDASVVSRHATGSIANEFVRIADEEGADLIVCGAYGHSRAREWVLGGVTRDLLDHSPLCCLMAH